MREFDLIRRLQERFPAPPAPPGSDCVLGIGDDAAVFEVPPGQQLVACTDTLAEGVHFPVGTDAAAIGHKALAVNLSDLAAMGATPAWFLLALTLPSAADAWIEAFADGMATLAAAAPIRLAGGDVASGPLNVCVTALGLVASGAALTRSGARVGDLVVVSGRPGAAAHALQTLLGGGEPTPGDRAALDYPRPRLALGLALRGVASACIDVSDGLLADLGHILEASGVGAEVDAAGLPVPTSLAEWPEARRLPLQLAGGDDYELCFTLPARLEQELPALAARGGVELSVIGRIVDRPGLTTRCADGSLFEPPRGGYEHFGAGPGARP